MLTFLFEMMYVDRLYFYEFYLSLVDEVLQNTYY